MTGVTPEGLQEPESNLSTEHKTEDSWQLISIVLKP